jgi:hypothetical protein
MNIKPIETVYNGYRFRSRLEAKWAVFFDAAGIKYQYEPEGFELEDGTRYLPDFYLPELDTHCEVKANTKDAIKDIVRYASMIVWGGPIKRLVLLSDIPGECKDGGLWHFPVLHYQDCGCAALDERKNTIAVAWFFFYNDSDATGETKTYGAISSASYPRPFSVGNGKLYRKDGFSLAAKTDTELHRMKNKNYDPFPGDINDLVFDSLRKARQARFEHGESGYQTKRNLTPKEEIALKIGLEEYEKIARYLSEGGAKEVSEIPPWDDNPNLAANKPIETKHSQADIDNDPLMQAPAMQRQKQKPEISRLFNWEDAL